MKRMVRRQVVLRSVHSIQLHTEGSDDLVTFFRIATNEFNPKDLLKSSGLVVQLKKIQLLLVITLVIPMTAVKADVANTAL
ncbi:hypothetical protein O9993_17975 [Vibrio lentus]|nr:hypothetical protein [Vibrio lentus]